MKAISKILFNNLASKRGMNLPRIGSIGIVEESARMSGNKLTPPHTRAVFSGFEKEELTTLVDEIARIGGMPYDEAEAAYDSWVAEIRRGKEYDIEGVGRIRSSSFIPSRELQALIDPNPPQTMSMKMRGAPWLAVTAIVLAVAAMGMFGYYVWRTDRNRAEPAAMDRPQKIRPESIPGTPEHEAAQAALAKAGAEAKAAHEAAQREAGKPVPTRGSDAAPANYGQGLSTLTSGTYYVVIGVFALPSNADKCIRQTKRVVPSLDPVKYSYRGSLNMVSIYSTANQAEARQILRQYRYLNHEMWIYRRR